MSDNSFELIPAFDVSLASCQSLCDLLRELPLPTPTQHNNALSSRSLHLRDSLASLQMESALSLAKQQLADLVFNELPISGSSGASMSPLALQMSMKGLFFGQNSFCETNHESLETIEPSLRLDSSFDDSLKLIDDLSENLENDFSSLGERVKQSRRQTNNEIQNVREEDRDRERDAKKEVSRDRDRETKEVKRKTKEKRKSVHSVNQINSLNDFQSKDSVSQFETIVNRLMSDCCEEESDSDSRDDSSRRQNHMSFDLRIDLKELNVLTSLSSKLKHSNRSKDLEIKLSSKLTSFLSLLTNRMIVWFSTFKEQEISEERDHEDNIHFQFLTSASKMSLNLMTANGMSSRVVLFEELLEVVIGFLAHSLNSKTHVSTTKTSPKKKTTTVVTQTVATRRQVTHWSELLELLVEYIARNSALNDSLVLTLTRASMSALLLSAPELTSSAVSLLSHVFRQYTRHRQSILEEILVSAHRFSAVKREKSSHILTRLLIGLTNALFDSKVALTREALTRALTDCLSVISSFLSSLVKRCLSQTNSESDLKLTLDSVLNDLLQQLYSPQTMASLLLIQIITKLLISNLKESKVLLALRLNSMEFLANIASKFAQLLSQKQSILEESETTLQQLSQDQQREEPLIESLRLLSRYFQSEKLYSERAILSSLWLKEEKISQIEDKFFETLKSKQISEEEVIESKTASLLIKSLELNHFQTLARLFDAALSHVTACLSLTSNTTQRSRAMKSLSQILVNCTLERASQLLSRQDIQVAMRAALLDASASVREATVDLIGRFVLQSKDETLAKQYVDLVGERILDTSVSVRKRVIRILRDVCQEFESLALGGELQLKIMKRAQDEGEGIRKLVLETTRDLFFKDVSSRSANSLLRVVSVYLTSDGSLDSLHALLEQIVSTETTSAQRLVDLTVQTVLAESGARGMTALAAVHLLALMAQIRPLLLEAHVDPLQSLLSLPLDSVIDVHLRNKVVQTLERVLPVVANPSPALVNRLEEDLTKTILQSSAHVLHAAVKCLAVLIERHTKNTRLAQDLFAKFRTVLLLAPDKPRLLRAVFSLGLFLKHFRLEFEHKQQVLDTILALSEQHLERSPDLVCKCVTALGFVSEAEPRICLLPKVVALYTRLLTDETIEEKLCAQTLANFRNYLSSSITSDEQNARSIEWSRESLKDMQSSEEDSSSLQSQVIQTYLALLLSKSLSSSLQIRRVACNVVHVIQSGGHVHPLQLVPHLIAMTTDDDSTIRSRADHVLHEIERKFHGFVAMKARAGIELALQLCVSLRVRGFRLTEDSTDVTSRLATLYHVVCVNRQSRRGFVQQLLRSFEVTTEDDRRDVSEETTIDDRTQLMFEMVLFFPFSVCDEILFILQQLECIQSVNSTLTSQLFSDLFGFQSEEEMDDKFDESDETFSRELEERADIILCKSQAILRLKDCLKKVFLVSFLRRLLKEFYLLKDDKILEYSPNESKTWEKPIHRRHIETSHLSQCLLSANPSLDPSNVSLESLLEELRRFKSVSLSSSDPKVSNQSLQQKLFTIQQKTRRETTIMLERNETKSDSLDSDLNESERQRLIDSIRKTSCHVSLVDIGIDSQLMKTKKRLNEEKERDRERDTPKKKKKKRKRLRVESESENATSDSDQDFH